MHTICLIATTNDPASMNMQKICIKSGKFLKTEELFEDFPVYKCEFGSTDTYLITSKQRSVEANNLDVQIKKELKNLFSEIHALIFLSKHASVSKIPSFCVHTQGNWGKAELGGEPKTLGKSPTVLKNELYTKLYHQAQKQQFNFDVVHEATHHGPNLETPTMFYEIGSTKKEWEDTLLGQFMIEVLFHTLDNYTGERSGIESIFCIGGSHTCTNFNRLSYEQKANIAHVCPNYEIDSLTKTIVQQAMDKSTTECQIVVDWKSLNSKQREKITVILSSWEWKKLKAFKSEVD